MPCEAQIADEHGLFRKCHQEHWDFERNRADKAAYHFDREKDDCISVFWSERIKASEVLPLFDKAGEAPASSESGVLLIYARDVRVEGTVDVRHTPHATELAHESHSSIFKKFPLAKRTRLAVYEALAKVSTPAIRVPTPTGTSQHVKAPNVGSG